MLRALKEDETFNSIDGALNFVHCFSLKNEMSNNSLVNFQLDQSRLVKI